MIVYNLTCDQSHTFEGWFSSSEEFDKQLANKQISCPNCGSTKVTKQLSAPYVNTGSAHKNPLANKQTETALAGRQELFLFVCLLVDFYGQIQYSRKAPKVVLLLWLSRSSDRISVCLLVACRILPRKKTNLQKYGFDRKLSYIQSLLKPKKS